MIVTGIGDDDTVIETDGPITIKIDHGEETLEIVVSYGRVYFRRYEGEEDYQSMFKHHTRILNRLKKKYG